MSRIEISPEWLAGLKELAEKATPGPWIMGQDGEVYSEDQDDFPVDIIEGICVEQSDAAYIAAASPDVVIALIEKIEKQEKEVEWLVDHVSTLCGQIENCDTCAYGDGAYCSIDRCLGDDPEMWREAASKAVEGRA